VNEGFQGRAILTPTHHHRRKRTVFHLPTACCVFTDVTAMGPRCQMSLLLAHVTSLWEIVPEVVVNPGAQREVAAHLSFQHEYLVHASLQDWTPGSEMKVLRPAWVEGWMCRRTPSDPGPSYLRRFPCSPTVPPHHQTAHLRPDLSTHIDVQLTFNDYNNGQ